MKSDVHKVVEVADMQGEAPVEVICPITAVKMFEKMLGNEETGMCCVVDFALMTV